MKLVVLMAAGIVGRVLAGTVAVADLPKWDLVDTEVSTNCVLRITPAERRHLSLAMELAATPSNNVQVAFGRDVNTNGILEVWEQQLVLGWDCGRWVMREGFRVSELQGFRIAEELGDWECEAVDGEVVKRLEVDVWSLRGEVIRAKWLENGQPLDWGLPEKLPSELIDENWDMLRLTVRGVDAASERFRVRVSAVGTVIYVK